MNGSSHYVEGYVYGGNNGGAFFLTIIKHYGVK